MNFNRGTRGEGGKGLAKGGARRHVFYNRSVLAIATKLYKTYEIIDECVIKTAKMIYGENSTFQDRLDTVKILLENLELDI